MKEETENESGGKITWGQLKHILESSGISDEDEIDRIDLGWGDPQQIKIEYDEIFGWQIFL
jgi:hypothetical protein